MELVVQLFLAVVVFGVTLSGGSLVWPKVTHAPRPQLLQEVHDTVVKTPIGSQAAQVLGVTDDKNVQPINLGEIANNAWSGIKNEAQKRAQIILMSQVTAQLTNQYDKLPKDQQKTLQEIICHSSPSGVVK
ncbi:MAG: hypothetical protein NT149_02990 [Candidatus Gottesmanbacteria bacterium]|nr:hypothetical protein [Candidatus Gottesmanbacteria bacterium]